MWHHQGSCHFARFTLSNVAAALFRQCYFARWADVADIAHLRPTIFLCLSLGYECMRLVWRCCAVQGLAVHGSKGQQLSDAALPPAVVGQAFRWASAEDISCVAFLGDECATLKLTSELRELHSR
jgi:hypothetical protein